MGQEARSPFRWPFEGKAKRAERLLAVLSCVVTLLFVGTLRDSAVRFMGNPSPDVPPLPDTVTDRPGKVVVVVENEAEARIASVSVRVLSIQDDRAYLAGAARTDSKGMAAIGLLPAGETWILAEGEGTARASTRIVLDAEPREVKIRLDRAETLRVAVADDGGTNIAEALVEVASGDPLPFSQRTDAAGVAAFSRLARPPWSVQVKAAGFEAVTQAVPKSVIGPVKVTLRRLGFIDVTAVDVDGVPLGQATVLVAGTAFWPARRTRTDATGRAKIPDLPRGIYDFRATHGDLVSAGENSVSIGRGESKSVTLTLLRGRSVAVRVTDGEEEGARPIPSANLVLAEGGLSSFPLEGKTDAQGAATLGPIGPGEAFLSAQAEGFVPRTGVAVPQGASPSVRIALPRGATLIGDVVDLRGYPVDGASIEIVGTTPTGEPIDESPERAAFRTAHFSWALTGPRDLVPAGELGVIRGPIPGIPHTGQAPRPTTAAEPWVTRDDGTFRAFPVPPGRVRALVRHPAYVEGASEFVELKAAGEGHVRVVLRAGGTLEGRVLDDRRQPLAGARIDLAATKGSLQRTTFSTKDGSFAFAAVPGDVVLSVGRPEAMDDIALRMNVAVKDGERKEVELVLPGSREPCTVEVATDDGALIDGAQVTLSFLSADVPLQRTLFTGRDGRAVFTDAVGLPVRVAVAHRGHAPFVQEVASAPALLRITATGGIRVSGTITTRRGRDRLDGAEVTLYAPSGPLRGRTDRDGIFRLEDVPAGAMRLSAAHAGYARVDQAVRIDPPSRADRSVQLDPIDLAEGGAVEGLVVDARGDPVAGARVQGTLPAAREADKGSPGPVLTNRRGEFKIEELPEGDVIIEASAPDVGRGRLAGVRVTAGRTTDRVRITLGAPEIEPTSDLTSAAGVALALEDRGPAGVQVASVASGSEAEKAGILTGDRLVAVDGQRVSSARDARARLFGAPDDDVVIEIERGQESQRFRLRRERVQR
jgi:S1-C subfamily serine protease